MASKSNINDADSTFKFNVSVILPIYNSEPWLEECLKSIWAQEKQSLTIEISAFLDSCTDKSSDILKSWIPKFESVGFHVTIGVECNEKPKGVGYSKNKAINQSSGHFLCFMDADDIMEPSRIYCQFKEAKKNWNAIVGSRFKRIPSNSTPRFTDWANSMTEKQLNTQIYTSHGPTIIMPTWFCHRSLFKNVKPFSEEGRGIPEDLIFFYQHVRNGGQIVRCDQHLLQYRYHTDAATFSVHQETIWQIRIKELEERVLNQWTVFTIWNGGKQGRKFYRSLSDENRKKIESFCDVDSKKIGHFYTYEHFVGFPKPKIPIVHFKDATPPFIICVKLNLTKGDFEQNLLSLQLQEGEDYHHFN